MTHPLAVLAWAAASGCFSSHGLPVESDDAGTVDSAIAASDSGAQADSGDPPSHASPCRDGTVEVEAGRRFGCALCAGGAVYCWGEAGLVMGTSGGEDSRPPTRMTGLPPLVDISLGFRTACGADEHGAVLCWGMNDGGIRGPEGIGEPARLDLPTVVPGLAGVVQVAVSPAHACALRGDGAVLCWGTNISGQLGRDVLDPFASVALPAAVVEDVNGATLVVTAGSRTCALLSSGAVWCWGDNRRGYLGVGAWTGSEPPLFMSARPMQVRGLREAVGLAAGGGSTCALRADGTVACWGDDLTTAPELNPSTGELESPFEPLPRTVPGLWSVTSIAASNANTCALLAGGLTFCWGDNALGGNGNGRSEGWQTEPSAVVELPLAVALGGGSIAGHLCGVTADQTIWCWGDNHHGQLGRPARTEGLSRGFPERLPEH